MVQKFQTTFSRQKTPLMVEKINVKTEKARSLRNLRNPRNLERIVKKQFVVVNLNLFIIFSEYLGN